MEIVMLESEGYDVAISMDQKIIGALWPSTVLIIKELWYDNEGEGTCPIYRRRIHDSVSIGLTWKLPFSISLRRYLKNL